MTPAAFRHNFDPQATTLNLTFTLDILNVRSISFDTRRTVENYCAKSQVIPIRGFRFIVPMHTQTHPHTSDVKASGPDWHWCQNFGLGLGLDKLASASSIWPRPGLGLVNFLEKCAIQCKIILVVSISWLYHCNIHYKDMVKHSNVGHKFIYVFL